jgi:SAM-dependent methyltransferase
VRRLIASIPQKAKLLDLGCGNGNFALALAHAGFEGSYLGIDGSNAFIQEAQQSLARLHTLAEFRFQTANLASLDWTEALQPNSFDRITCFAVLQHLPGKPLQQAIFMQSALLLRPGGQLMLSVWQVFHSPTLAARILPWATVDIDPKQIDHGDILLDWRAGPGSAQPACRYVHVFSSEELLSFGETAGLNLNSEFYSDGKNQRLGLYQVWQKP